MTCQILQIALFQVVTAHIFLAPEEEPESILRVSLQIKTRLKTEVMICCAPCQKNF